MTAQTFVDSDFTTFYVADFQSVIVGERTITVPACTSSAGDTLIMILYKQALFAGGGRDQTGSAYGLEAPTGWDYVAADRVGVTAAGDEVRIWSKESDGAQGNVTLNWPSPDYRSSQVIFAAMLAYSAADGYVNTNFPDPGYEWVGTAQLETKRTVDVDTDMSFDAMGLPCTLDATLSYFFYAKDGAAEGVNSMVNAIDIDAGLNERIRWQVPPAGGDPNILPEPREIVIADEFNVDLTMPARTNTQVIQNVISGQDHVVWYARRQGIYGIPDNSGNCGEQSAYWGVKIELV